MFTPYSVYNYLHSNKFRKVTTVFYGAAITLGLILTIGTILIFFTQFSDDKSQYPKFASTLLQVVVNSTVYILLCRIIKSIFTKIATTGRPFQQSICSDIKHVGSLILIANIALPILNSLVLMISNGGIGNDLYTIPFSIGNILLGIIVLFLSKVFEYGVELQEESDETL